MPHTTGLRITVELAELGLIETRAGDSIKKKRIVTLSGDGKERMRRYLAT